MKKLKPLPKTINLTITKKDCQGFFTDSCDCAVARSFLRRFPHFTVSEHLTFLRVNEFTYDHKFFGAMKFYRIAEGGKSVKLKLVRA